MSKEKFLDRINTLWQDFIDSYQGLSSEQMEKPGVAGKWSVSEIIAHVTIWEAESLKHLPIILAGEKPPRYSTTYGGIDAFNAQAMNEWKNVSLAEILSNQEKVHRDLIEFLSRVPEEHFTRETRLRRRLKWDTFGHYLLHAGDIRKWREMQRK